jgi:hypothetical protein
MVLLTSELPGIISRFYDFSFFFFWWWYWGLLMLLRQVLYLLIHASRPFLL